jgi:RNA polymerase subunit RPABC4/transcription elongation factor Spt4
MKDYKICPNCESSYIPNNVYPGEYPGALSRVDNKTEICSDCGTMEALDDYYKTNNAPRVNH